MSNNSAGSPEVRLEIPPDESQESTSNSSSSSRRLQFELNTQQIINNVLARIDVNQRISTFLDQQQQQQQQPSSPTHHGTNNNSPESFNGDREIPAEHSPPQEDQNDEQYIIIWITVLKTLIQYIPIVLILLLKCTLENVQVIVDVLLLHAVTWHLNLKYKAEVAKKTQRSKARLAVLLLYILAVIHFILTYSIGESTRLGLLLIYSDTNVSLSQLLYQVIITDCILKLVSVFLKICITILPIKWIHFKQRSRSYAFIENLSQFYRCLAPVHIWLDHFFFAYSGWKSMFGAVFSALYLGYKGFDINKRFKPVRKSFLALYRNVVSSNCIQ